MHTNIRPGLAVALELTQRISEDPQSAACDESSSSLTYTAHPSGVEFKVRWAITMVASRDVDTHPVNTDSRVCTFIDV